MDFLNQQVSQTTARQIEKDMDRAREQYMKGNATPLNALMANHVGNVVIERFGVKVMEFKNDADYKAWLADMNELSGCAS